MTASLYERLGGEPAVSAAVEIFYRKVLSDDRISHFFDDADMDRQIAKQKAFLTLAFGGPNNYSGADMRRGHAHLVAKGYSMAVSSRLLAASALRRRRRIRTARRFPTRSSLRTVSVREAASYVVVVV